MIIRADQFAQSTIGSLRISLYKFAVEVQRFSQSIFSCCKKYIPLEPPSYGGFSHNTESFDEILLNKYFVCFKTAHRFQTDSTETQGARTGAPPTSRTRRRKQRIKGGSPCLFLSIRQARPIWSPLMKRRIGGVLTIRYLIYSKFILF